MYSLSCQLSSAVHYQSSHPHLSRNPHSPHSPAVTSFPRNTSQLLQPSYTITIIIIIIVAHWSHCRCVKIHQHLALNITIHTEWAKKLDCFVTVCNSRICWHRIAFYMWNCSVFFIQSTTGLSYVTVFKYSLCNFSVTTLCQKSDFSDDVHLLHTIHLEFTINFHQLLLGITKETRSSATAEIVRDAWNGHSRSLKVIRCCANRHGMTSY